MAGRGLRYTYVLWLSEVATTDHTTTYDADADGGGLRAVASRRVRRRRWRVAAAGWGGSAVVRSFEDQ